MFGFWFEMPTADLTAVHTALPIKQADSNRVYFGAHRKENAINEGISGSVDRITGAVSTMENKLTRPATRRPQSGICTASRRARFFKVTALRLAKRRIIGWNF